MKKLICPLSEEFLYCSPERPENECYRVLMKAQQTIQMPSKNHVIKANCSRSWQSELCKKSGITWLVKNIALLVISAFVISITTVILMALGTLAIESI